MQSHVSQLLCFFLHTCVKPRLVLLYSDFELLSNSLRPTACNQNLPIAFLQRIKVLYPNVAHFSFSKSSTIFISSPTSPAKSFTVSIARKYGLILPHEYLCRLIRRNQFGIFFTLFSQRSGKIIPDIVIRFRMPHKYTFVIMLSPENIYLHYII